MHPSFYLMDSILSVDSFPVLIKHEEIHKKIVQFSKILAQEFEGQAVVLIMIMKGAICFAADLIRELPFNFSLEYISCESYGMKGTLSTDLKVFGVERLDLKGKTVIVLDDIFDTGRTIEKVLQELKKQKPKLLKTLFLLSKKRRRDSLFSADYFLFEIEDVFVIGYGMDYKEQYRGLKDICYISGQDL